MALGEDQGTVEQPSAGASSARFLSVALLAVALSGVWALLQLSGLADIPFHSKGEPREAIAVQDVVYGGRYVMPLRNAYEMPRKPPLFYWLGGVAGILGGEVDEATVRLPSAVQSYVAVLLVFAVGIVAGSPLAGFLSALVLLTSFEWMRSAVSARIDMTLALGTTASFAGLYMATRRPALISLLLFYGGMVWGTLAKGPIGIVLPALCAMAVVLVESGSRWLLPLAAIGAGALVARQLGAPTPFVGLIAAALFAPVFIYVAWDRARPLHPIAGAATVAALTAVWYGLATRAAGEEFIRKQILAENFGRFLGTAAIEVGHQHGTGYLFGALAAGFLPWTLFLPGIAVATVRHRDSAARALVQQSLVWIVMVFAFFTLSSSKRSVYLLPLYPAAASLAGLWLADVCKQRPAAQWLAWLGQALAVMVILLSGAIAGVFTMELLGLNLRQAIVDPIVTAAAGTPTAATLSAGFTARAGHLAAYATATLLTAVALLFFAMRRHSAPLVAALIATVVALQLLVQRGVMPAVTPASDRSAFAAELRRVAAGRPITTSSGFDAALVFHLGGAVPVVDIADGPAVEGITVLATDEWRRLSPQQRAPYEAIAGLSVRKQGNQVPVLAIQRVRFTLDAESESATSSSRETPPRQN